MQHNPVVTYLRMFGFAIGLAMFLFMVFHFEQGARDPVYVKGKPSLQWFAVSTQVSSAAASNPTDSPAEVAETAHAAEASTSSSPIDIPQSEAKSHSSYTQSEKTVSATQHSQQASAGEASVNAGKALGRDRRSD